MEKVYAVCEDTQKELINKYCFGSCGEILVGGILYDDKYYSPCRCKECPHELNSTSIGDITLDAWGEINLTLRTLKE